MKLFKPDTLKMAIEKAKIHEKAIEAAQKKNKAPYKATITTNHAPSIRNPIPATSRPNPFRLGPSVYEYRKSNHLCFRCGDKYTPGSQCKRQQLNCIVREVEPPDGSPKVIEDPSYQDLIIEGDEEQVIQEVVCLNGLTGQHHTGQWHC